MGFSVFLYRKYWVNGASTIRTVAICKGSENPFAKKRSNLTKKRGLLKIPKKTFSCLNSVPSSGGTEGLSLFA